MKSCNQYESSPVRIFLTFLVILFTLCIGPVHAASEPGTVTLVFMTEFVNLDPADTGRSSIGQVLLKNVAEPLVDRSLDGTISPRLATSWKQIDDKTWHFFLRKGVKFHDGADFNAEAAVFNIKRLYDKRIVTTTRTKFFPYKMEARAVGSHTLEIKLEKPEPLVLTSLSVLSLCSPNTSMDKLVRNPIGTGPYKFVKWDAGTQIVLERFDGYWGKQPQVKKAVYVWRGESAVRASMVAIGEADLAVNIAVQDATRRDMDHGYLDSETICIRMSDDKGEPPLNDRRVRMALNYAIDREAIRGSILSKDSLPATQMYVPTTFGYNPDLKVWPYDPSKAKQLLNEARKEGVPVDREISLVARVGHYPGGEELAEAVMNMCKSVGLNVKLKMLESGVYNLWREKPYPTNVGPYLTVNKHDNSFGDPAFTFLYLYHCTGRASTMCDKEVDDLIGKAQVAMGEERKDLWRTATKRVHEEIVPVVMLFHMVSYTRIGKRINFKPSMAIIYEIPLEQITFN